LRLRHSSASRGRLGSASSASELAHVVGRDDLTDQLRKYLADAHAIEEQAIALLERGPKLAGSEHLANIYEDHLADTDTPGKLAALARAFEHLEIGGYEQLQRVALLVGDEDTARVVERILAQEREASDRIAAAFGEAAEASLEALGVR
jgi:ferritin-like metal-binding protein YciE